MPESNPIKKDDPNVAIDTSGPEVDVALPEEKTEEVVNTTEAPKQETETTEKDTDKTFENERETKLEEKKDQELEDYSKGVQARIAKLTRKMREAERREKAATEYARAVEEKRQALEKRFEKTDADYLKKFESTISSGMEAAQKELAAAIESGDANAQVEANKRIATLAFENAKLAAAKEGREEQKQTQAEKPVQLSDGPTEMPSEPAPDPKAEEWASRNSWFGQDRAMTYTAFEIHKDLVAEGFDPKSDDYYAEVDKRIKVDFPHKFGNTSERQSTVQTVASAQRSVNLSQKV